MMKTPTSTVPNIPESAVAFQRQYKRARRGENSSNRSSTCISDAAILQAVEVEFDRTLPFWRCYMDLRDTNDVTRYRPTVISREVEIQHRVPCSAFPNVDVVWASTRAVLRMPTGKVPAPIGYCGGSPAARRQSYWDTVPHLESVCTLGTMHFVHHDAHLKSSSGADRSFHIQSVVYQEDPAILQCVAGTMVSFLFIVHTSLRLLAERKGDGPIVRGRQAREMLAAVAPGPADRGHAGSHLTAPLWSRYCPSTSSRALILGMGGNSMAMSLRKVLGPDAVIHVVEMEPAVVKVCRLAGTLACDGATDHTARTDPNLHIHLCEAGEFLLSPPGEALNGTFDMVFMDLFEPINAAMAKCESLVNLCEAKLAPGGLMAVNDHQLPSPDSLRPFRGLFGAGNVLAVNLHGWNESIIVCLKPGVESLSGLASSCSKHLADTVFNLYESLMPGWLPHHSWLKCVKTIVECRVFFS